MEVIACVTWDSLDVQDKRKLVIEEEVSAEGLMPFEEELVHKPDFGALSWMWKSLLKLGSLGM